MIVPGGFQFDDLENINGSSSDDDSKGRLSQRSDASNISNFSTDSASSTKSALMEARPKFCNVPKIPQAYIQDDSVNSSSIKQKEMVMNEIKRKVFSSDSERENDLNDSIDGIEFGKTPPRESRRNKQKYKVKFNNQQQFNVKKPMKKTFNKNGSNPANNFNSNQHHWQRQRSDERREKQIDKFDNQMQECNEFVPRSTKLVRVNSTKSLKSIAQQRTLNAFSQQSDNQGSKKFMSSAVKFATKKMMSDSKSKASSRQHFHKSFSLLVNLGGRLSSQHQHHEDEIEEDNFQVEYHEFLWLQLQAYHSARTLEEQDNYLEEARKGVDKILDDIINFRFDAKKGSCPDICALDDPGFSHAKESTFSLANEDSDDGEFLSFKTSFDADHLTSSPRNETVDIPKEESNEMQSLQERLDNALIDQEEKPTEQVVSKNESTSDTGNSVADTSQGFNLLGQRKEKIAAIHEIAALLQKVEGVESLYPNTKALMEAHPKYKDIRFVRNLEALLFWLNVSKDLYHQLNVLADWIEIEPDDVLNFKDWFDCGLDLQCLKTKKSYKTAHKIATADMLESSVNLPSLLSNVALRRSKREKRKRISQQRFSVIEKTSTSRYREFVERNIRENGLLFIMKRVREILYIPLKKAKFCIDDPTVNSTKFSRVFEIQFGNQLNKMLSVFLKLNDTKMANFINDIEKEAKQFNKYAQYGKCFQDMNLPTFVDIFSFMVLIPFDVVHESIRFRIDYKPKVQPSHLSIRQLILECKEVVAGGIIALHHFREMTTIIPDATKAKLADRKNEFDDDLKSVLNVYFEYLQTSFHLMQKSKQASFSLKNIAEEEWDFAKEICPYISGAEARAGFKFCCLSSDLLKSTEHYLESSMEECSEKYSPADEENLQRHKLLGVSREYKHIFKELRGRASKALAFARMLHKDLGISNKYKLHCSTDTLFKMLKDSKHFKVDYHGMNIGFWVFVTEEGAKDESFSTKLLNLTFGIPDHDNSLGRGYVLLVPKKSKEKCLWIGRRMSIEYTSEVALALSYIDQVEYVTVISNNLYNLNTQCKRFEQRLNPGAVSLIVERTSSHMEIEKALNELKESTYKLAQSIVTSTQIMYDNLCSNQSIELDEADLNSAHKSCIETMHSSFAVGFEYLRELARMVGKGHGSHKKRISHFFVTVSRLWIQFVLTKTEQGRGTKPRWAIPGLEFLVATIDPSHTESMEESVFLNLQEEMQKCVKHIIGRAESRSKRKLKADKRSSSPFTVYRSRSVPASQLKDGSQSLENIISPSNDTINVRNSFPGEFVRSVRTDTTLSDTSADRISTLSNVSSEGDTLDSVEQSFLDGDVEPVNDPPMIRIRNAIQEIEERRTAKLQHMRVIGNVTYKKANFASELVHNVRKVNFKWQLGNKIGEGQFGKVYSAVNLDTGDLMAVKQVRFNPHDYGTVQEIADEITNIQGLLHDSLVKYFGVEIHKNEMLIFMEYCADGTIAEVAKVGLPESLIRVYTYQIIKAINFLHQSGVVHRDIKGANIFLSSSGLIKIGDFGSAVKLKDPMCTTQGEVFNTRGTAAFMAPEVITLDKGRGYGRAADIWSLGCVVIEMSTGKQPWYECDNIYAIMYRVGDGNHPPIPDRLSEEGRDFLECCFIHDQNYRWTANMLEDHAFVKVKK